MSILLFKLSHVPEDEAEDIRTLLDQNKIEFYETHAGFFGTSVAGLWLQREEQFDTAKQLLSDYQNRRSERVRFEYAQQIAAGNADTFWRKVKRQPIKIVFCLLAAALVLCISIIPFLGLSEWW